MVKDQQIEKARICYLSATKRVSSAEVMLHLIQRMRKRLTWLKGQGRENRNALEVLANDVSKSARTPSAATGGSDLLARPSDEGQC